MSYVQMKVYMKNNIEVYKYYSGKLGKKIYNAPAQGRLHKIIKISEPKGRPVSVDGK